MNEILRKAKKGLAVLSLIGVCVTALPGINVYSGSTPKEKIVCYTILGITGSAILIFGFPVLCKHLRSNGSAEERCKVKNWDDVAEKWMDVANHKDNNSPDYLEALAEHYRCLTYINKERYRKAVKKYNKASNRFLGLSAIYDSSDSNHELYNAKASEMQAKAAELCFKYGNCKNHFCKENSYDNCRVREYRFAWDSLVGKKPSYDAYAKAHQAEAIAAIRKAEYDDRVWNLEHRKKVFQEIRGKSNSELWRIAAQRWEDVKTDEELIESLGGSTSVAWIAFHSLAEASKQECLYEAGDVTSEAVAEAWKDTYKKDCQCATAYPNSRYTYDAFAAEAYLRYQLALKGTVLK